MPTMFFQEDDFVVTFDPTQVVRVRTGTQSYFFDIEDDDVVVPKDYEALCKLILGLVKDNFELPSSEAMPETQISYRLEGFVASRFVLGFPNLKDYEEALKQIKDSLHTKFGQAPCIEESVKNLEFAVNFPAYYSFYKDNKALIISILGEPDANS